MTDAAEKRQPVADRTSWQARHRATAAGFWLAVLFRLIATAPRAVRSVKPVFVRLAYRCSRKIRQSTDANARRILNPAPTAGQRRDFGLGVVSSFYDFVCDIGQSLRQTGQQLVARIESAEGDEQYHAVRRQGKGAILLTAHMGSFEVGLVALAAHEKRIHVVFKRDDVGSFEKLRTQLRKQLNIREAPIEDGLAGWVNLRSALLNNEVVAIQGDRVMPGQKGMAAPVLGGHMLLPTGPFKLALASDSPVVPIFSVRTPRGGIRIFLEEAIWVSTEADGVERAVLSFSGVLAKYIAKYPDQWLVLDKAFCEDHSPGQENAQ